MKNILALIIIAAALPFATVVHAQDAKEVARKVLPSVVLVEVFDSYGRLEIIGSGFFIRKDIVATNYHVIANAASAKVTIVGSNSHLAVLGTVGIDRSRDLALLQVDQAIGTPL